MVKVRQMTESTAKFLNELISRPSERMPRRMDVTTAWIDLYTVMPLSGSPVTSLGTPKALEIATKSYVIMMVQARHVAYM